MSQTSTTQTGATETHAFQAETRQVLQLMIHSLYSNKEIFLREMISNASDALDQLRFVAIQNDSIYEGDSELYIEIEVDEEAGTLTVRDNGIGMNREEVMENIGTIAKSGTRAVPGPSFRRPKGGCADYRPVWRWLLLGFHRCGQGDATQPQGSAMPPKKACAGNRMR